MYSHKVDRDMLPDKAIFRLPRHRESLAEICADRHNFRPELVTISSFGNRPCLSSPTRTA
jgi:hypothetical protein